MLEKYYRIPTSLSIAAARLAEMMPAALKLPAGVVILTLDRQAQDEAVHLTLRPVSYHTTCGAWQVRVTPDAMHWTHAGAQVTLTPDGESVFAGSEARERRARCCVMARLPDLRLPAPDFWAWRLDARLVAVTPNQVSLALWTLRMGDVLQSLDEQIKKLGWTTSAQGDTPSSREIHPHPLRDRRARVRELRLQGKTVKEIAMEIDETEDIVKADLRWLRQKGYLEVLSR
jgi:DNA-binding CsgD family transcriptional regulator